MKKAYPAETNRPFVAMLLTRVIVTESIPIHQSDEYGPTLGQLVDERITDTLRNGGELFGIELHFGDETRPIVAAMYADAMARN